jgi:hypothetical protein
MLFDVSSCVMKSVMICVVDQMLRGCSDQGGGYGWGYVHVWGRRDMHVGFLWENLKVTDQ